MKSLKCSIFNLLLSVLGPMTIGLTAQAKDVTYVRVSAGVPVQDEVVKNFNLVRAVEEDGFVQMIAVYDQGDEVWRTRLIRTDTLGSVLWSKDYTFYEGPAYDIKLNNVPFSICQSISGEGYVISGIWDAHGVRPMEHGALQSPFYMEVGDTGQVIQVSRQLAYYATYQNEYCFAPLKIKPVGTQGYVAVGVLSDSLSEVTSSHRMGRICLLNDTFGETHAKLVRSEYAVTSNIRTNSGTLYDAFNNVEVVEVPGQGYSYVVTGSVTGDLACPTNAGDSDQYGNAQAYIARFDDTLGIVWEHLGFNYTGGDHDVISSTYVNTESNEVFFITYGVVSEKNHNDAVIGRLDLLTGSHTDSYILRINLNSTYFYFYNQIYKVLDTLWLTGYTYNDAVLPQGTPPNNELNPIILKLDLNSVTILEDEMLNPNSINYLALNQNCYLCYRKFGDNFLFTTDCVLNEFDTTHINNVRSPIIYSPTHTWFEPNGKHLLCGPFQDSSLVWSSPKLYGISGEYCESNPDAKEIINGPYLIDGNTHLESTYTQKILEYILLDSIEYQTEDCP